MLEKSVIYPLDLEEKRILLCRDRVVGVRIVMSENLTSQVIGEGGCGARLLTPYFSHCLRRFPTHPTPLAWEG